MIYFLFVVGFVLLIYGANWLVDGSTSLAKKFGVSNIVIGLTVVSFGTSAPELAVNVIASVSGNNDIAIGNVVGSNIANIWLVLGVPALIASICCDQKNIHHREVMDCECALVFCFVCLFIL